MLKTGVAKLQEVLTDATQIVCNACGQTYPWMLSACPHCNAPNDTPLPINEDYTNEQYTN